MGRFNRIEEILQNYVPVPDAGCWLWDGMPSRYGYGNVVFRKKMYRAHRFFYTHLVGQIPAGMHVCHKCDVRLCVNPSHLFIGTPQENVVDMIRKKRDFLSKNPELTRHARSFQFGEKHPQCKISNARCDEMRMIREATKTPYAALAHMFGVSQMTAWGICNGKARVQKEPKPTAFKKMRT